MMTPQIFIWYVFPWLVSTFGLCCLIYDHHKHPDR